MRLANHNKSHLHTQRTAKTTCFKLMLLSKGREIEWCCKKGWKSMDPN